MSFISNAEVINQKEITAGYYRLSLVAPGVAGAARPGQFLHVRCSNTTDPLLRRPISIHAVEREKGEVLLLYRVVGKGTALLSEKKKGDTLSLLGPLGRGFSMPASEAHDGVFVVAGGIGVAPLYFLLQELGEHNLCATVFLGATKKEQLLLVSEIKSMGHKVFVATDDGSAGFCGTVTDLMKRCMQGDFNRPLVTHGGAEVLAPGSGTECSRWVYGCGPQGMLKRLCEIIKKEGISGEVSVEERMGCGVGACLSCACKTREGENSFRYRRACVEGPVFPAGEVVWD